MHTELKLSVVLELPDKNFRHLLIFFQLSNQLVLHSSGDFAEPHSE